MKYRIATYVDYKDVDYYFVQYKEWWELFWNSSIYHYRDIKECEEEMKRLKEIDLKEVDRKNRKYKYIKY